MVQVPGREGGKVSFRKMAAIESQIASSFGGNCMECSPKTVLFILDLDEGYQRLSQSQKRKAKKQATTQKVGQTIESEVFKLSDTTRSEFSVAEKKDDMADCFLLLYVVLLFSYNRLAKAENSCK